MEQRRWDRLGRDLGVVGLGCWQIGADWGQVSDDDALTTLHAAADAGVTCFDTADVYGDGRSERLVGTMRAERIADEEEPVFVATKLGRRANPHVPEAFTREAMAAWIDRSRANLGMDTLDLVQLHCPPTPVFADDRVVLGQQRLLPPHDRGRRRHRAHLGARPPAGPPQRGGPADGVERQGHGRRLARCAHPRVCRLALGVPPPPWLPDNVTV